MNKLSNWIAGILIAVGGILVGFFIRQPKINKLRKQIESLQKNNQRLLDIHEQQQSDFRKLLAQHKALKAHSLGKKKRSDKMLQENLELQYAELDYLELLLKRVKFEHKMSREEKSFFKAYEKVVNGKNISTSTMIIIRGFTRERHSDEIKNHQECDLSAVMQELNNLSLTD